MDNKLPATLSSLLEKIAAEEQFVAFKIDGESGSGKGDNFLGVVERVTIWRQRRTAHGSIETETLSLICKSAPANEARRKAFQIETAFEREILFYNELGPAFVKFQRDKGLSEREMFSTFPKCYGANVSRVTNDYVIVLDDLRAKGFRMWPKQKIGKLENIRLVVRELAKFHAVSFAMRDQSADTFAKFERLDDSWPKFFQTKTFHDVHRHGYRQTIETMKSTEHKAIYEDFLTDLQKYFLACSDETIPDKFLFWVVRGK